MRCALVEFNCWHGETLPTFVYLLNQLVGDVDVYLRRELLQRGPFQSCPGLRYRLHVLESPATRAWLKLRNLAEYDLVVATSVEPKPVLRSLRGIRVRLVGVVHNAILLEEDHDYRAFFREKGRTAVTLAKHVAEGCAEVLNRRWVAPVMVTERAEAYRPDWRRFCVQGRVDFKRRNYWSLLDAVSELVLENTPGFEVVLMGGDRDLDGLRLRRVIRQRRLEAYVTQPVIDAFSYTASIDGIASSGFILALVDTTSPIFAPYFEDKISSSISMALGTGRIPIIHHRLAELSGLQALCITYGDGGLGHAMEAALNLRDDARRTMVDGLHCRRRQLLRQSLENLRTALQDVGI